MERAKTAKKMKEQKAKTASAYGGEEDNPVTAVGSSSRPIRVATVVAAAVAVVVVALLVVAVVVP